MLDGVFGVSLQKAVEGGSASGTRIGDGALHVRPTVCEKELQVSPHQVLAISVTALALRGRFGDSGHAGVSFRGHSVPYEMQQLKPHDGAGGQALMGPKDIVAIFNSCATYKLYSCRGADIVQLAGSLPMEL